jgi:hypothetical protein
VQKKFKDLKPDPRMLFSDPKKLIRSLNLTALFIGCILTACAQISDSIQADQVYKIETWRVTMLVNDSYRARVLDTLVNQLDARVDLLAAENKELRKNYTKQVIVLKGQVAAKNSEVGVERSMKEYYQHESAVFRRQRNRMTAAIGILLVGALWENVWKPP